MKENFAVERFGSVHSPVDAVDKDVLFLGKLDLSTAVDNFRRDI
jgi:hypothetical protein